MPSEKFLAEFYDLPPSEWLKMMQGYVAKRFQPEQQAEAIQRTVRALQEIASADAQATIAPFSRGCWRVSDMPDETPPVERLWFGIYPGALTLLNGESGAGKSSALYNIAIHAARNEPLWRVPFGMHAPVRTLYIDPENTADFDRRDPGLALTKILRIAGGRPEHLEFHDGQGVKLSDPTTLTNLEEVVCEKKIQLLIIDPIINLFGTKDENDNAEGGKQFDALRGLVKRTGVAIVAVHHTGRDATSNFGRGATSRFGMADVVLSLRARTETDDYDDDYDADAPHERSDIVRLQINKNRIEPGKASLFLKMIGNDQFERVGFEDWKASASAKSGESRAPKAEQAEEFLYQVLSDRSWRDVTVIYDAMQKKGVGQRNTDKALKKLLDEGLLLRNRSGQGGRAFYRIGDSDPQADGTIRKPYAENDDDDAPNDPLEYEEG